MSSLKESTIKLDPDDRYGATRDAVMEDTTSLPQTDDEMQVLTAQQADREFRRKRRRQLYRLLKQPTPSFLAVLRSDPNQIEEDDDIPPPIVVIDVDAYLGFKGSRLPITVPSSESIESPPPVVSSISSHPADEGWYEGTRIMAMPEDATFLSDMHVWIRQHLEFFSATAEDIQHSQMGRRTKTVRGKVGLRCIHCARKILPQLQAGQKVSWPPGAVTYPLNFAGLYSGASQKPQLHFEACPYLPPDSKLSTMLQEARATQRGNAPLTGIRKRKRMVQGVSGLMYYVISCQRIGLTEVDDQGLRFTRDLTLEPLAFETIRMQVERERPDLIPRQYQAKPPPPPPTLKAITPDPAKSSGDLNLMQPNAATQVVVQKALEEADDPQHRLIRRSDKSMLTDYMFLAISQMAICHASPQDFAARGKKTKMMRLGLAGFCCRHCQHKNSMYSCRSYSSAPDNLASAISNSFILHLQKCPYTPSEIQDALASAKKIHTRQMAQMPYGSQRKLFFELWERMRAVDLPAHEMNDDEEEEDNHNGDEEWKNEVESMKDEDDEESTSKRAPRPLEVSSSTFMDSSRPNTRGVNFPVSSDAETQSILKAAEQAWDTSINDHLILPEDRFLVSDYVFLTMRQLKVAMPSPSDFRGNRRSNVISRMPGLCCIHCANDPTFHTPSGRSFPSAPDNMASALNSSFYNHMQHCPHLDPSTKRALQNLRKIHSQQCSSLTFGSQRRFFNKVYNKLKKIPMTKEQLAYFTVGAGAKEHDASTILDDQVFREHFFVEAGTVGIPYWQCLRCRMVPFEFRSIGAVHYIRPLIQHLTQHRSVCQGDGISLGWVNNAVQSICDEYKSDELEHAMKPLIEIVVGNDSDLVELFLDCVSNRGKDQSVSSTKDTSGWWRRLPHSIDMTKLQVAFEEMAMKMGWSSSSSSSSKLMDHPKLVRALEIMSPCLQLSLDSSLAQDPSGETPIKPLADNETSNSALDPVLMDDLVANSIENDPSPQHELEPMDQVQSGL